MLEHLRNWAAALTALVVIGGAGAAYAAGCCNVSPTHQIRVPGVVIGKPSVSPSKPSGCGDCKPPPSCGKDYSPRPISIRKCRACSARQ